MHLLYIDPGTGSALFSILIGAAAALYFLGRAFILKLSVIFAGGKISAAAMQDNALVIYNEGAQYVNVFKPVLDEFEKRGTKVMYLTSAEDDPILKESYQCIKGEYIGQGNKAYAHLNLLKAQAVLMTTPGLDVYQLKRSKGVKHYAHVLHAPSDATMYRLFGLDYFDSVLLSGDYQAHDIKTLEQQRGINEKQLLTVGCTYLDVYAEKIKLIPKEENHRFTVLVSPSWGASALLARFGEKLLGQLVKTGWRIIVRPHPQSYKSEKAMLDALINKYQDTPNLEWDKERENIYSLAKADIMISDFSGIIYDYAFLFDKPVMYVLQGLDLRPYDADDLGEDPMNNLWQFRTLKEIGIELREEQFDTIDKIIQDAADSGELKEARKKARDAAWQYRGESGRRIADFLDGLRQ
jgi:hypothetical protein